MTPDEIQTAIEDATYDHAMGRDRDGAGQAGPGRRRSPRTSFEAWHAAAEMNFELRRLDAALAAAERAHALRPDDLFINTSLSRIWMEKGDKAKAEHFGAQAKIQSWKDQLEGAEALGAPSRLASPRRRARASIIRANPTVKSRSLTSEWRKKTSVGANWGWPIVSACHQPAAVWA